MGNVLSGYQLINLGLHPRLKRYIIYNTYIFIYISDEGNMPEVYRNENKNIILVQIYS